MKTIILILVALAFVVPVHAALAGLVVVNGDFENGFDRWEIQRQDQDTTIEVENVNGGNHRAKLSFTPSYEGEQATVIIDYTGQVVTVLTDGDSYEMGLGIPVEGNYGISWNASWQLNGLTAGSLLLPFSSIVDRIHAIGNPMPLASDTISIASVFHLPLYVGPQPLYPSFGIRFTAGADAVGQTSWLTIDNLAVQQFSVPEPASVWLLGLALVALGWFRRLFG